MSWDGIALDLQDIVWDFCGDLRVPLTRYWKFVGLELRMWSILNNGPPLPSYIRRQYGFIGADYLKHTIKLAYVKTHRETILKGGCRSGIYAKHKIFPHTSTV